MTERRSLSAAVSTQIPGTDPDIVRSFVTQKRPTEKFVPSPISLSDESTSKKTESHDNETTASITMPKKKAGRFQPIGLIPVTIRLRPEIAGALKRASLERELDGEDVFTQQDLVENALEPWLKENGFLN
ncbi:MAG: hypothetical protein SGI77_22535 [Pirellulaceae bacterium]|nr:hypothetical protein [Pirellulaceae bacterium]